MYKQNKDCNLDDKFRPEDIDAAERFIDRKFPKVRQLFQTKYEEAADCCPKRFTKSSIDKLTSVYLDICGLLNIATSDLVDRTKNNLKRREPKECQLVKVDSVHLFT
ncbi:hypothetical protein M3Y95_01073900 [Aphelenchoides besseyi]|nr:hypothetical protein M3Y95_01073900 [Aphelenchoides besseyi]